MRKPITSNQDFYQNQFESPIIVSAGGPNSHDSRNYETVERIDISGYSSYYNLLFRFMLGRDIRKHLWM